MKSIGTFAAIKIKQQYPKLKVALIGNINRFSSASIVAGAMANVYAEIKYGLDKDINEARFLGNKNFYNS